MQNQTSPRTVADIVTWHRDLSQTARRTAFRYMHLAQLEPEDSMATLAYGTMACGSATLLKHLEEQLGVDAGPGKAILHRAQAGLQDISQQPGDQEDALNALMMSLWEMAEAEDSLIAMADAPTPSLTIP